MSEQEANINKLIDKVNKMEIDFTAVKSYITSESGNHTKLIDAHFELLQQLSNEIFGLGESYGIKSKVNNIDKLLNLHINHDMWLHGTMVTLLLFILGKLYIG